MNVFFIQGGGAGAYDEDTKRSVSLQRALGSGYAVHYPRMPDEDAPAYGAWRERIAAELAALGPRAVLVGHSLGASVPLRVVAAGAPDVAGLFLVAAPYWGSGGWEVAEYTLPEGCASSLPRNLPLFLYSSRDDEVVLFTHTERHAAELPGVTVRVFDEGGHQLGDDLTEVARDVQTLRAGGHGVKA